MNVKVTTKVGPVNYEFQLDDKEEMVALHKAIVLGNPPKYCHMCKNANSDHFKLDSNRDTESNTYISTVCTHEGCFATAKLGQYKAGGYFWHNFVEKYVKKSGSANPLS